MMDTCLEMWRNLTFKFRRETNQIISYNREISEIQFSTYQMFLKFKYNNDMTQLNELRR